MGKAIQIWVADDGTEFNNERDMVLHELSVLNAKEIDVFLQRYSDISTRKLNEYRKVLSEWQEYQHKQGQLKPVESEENNVTNVAEQIDAKIDAELKTMLEPSEDSMETTNDWPDGLEAVPLRVNG